MTNPVTPNPSQPEHAGGFQPSQAVASVKPKLGKGMIVGLIVGALVLFCCGVGVGSIGSNGDDKATAEPKASVPAVLEVSAAPITVAPTTTAPTTAPATTQAAPPPAPTTVIMPNLAGSNAAVAQDKLKRLGITNIKLGSQDEFDTLVILPENWTVKKQSQKAGAKVAQDELVVLTCTKTG
ncbi:PASTA domain-containing protein [Micromonospora sp. ALFpr18c]|uniref:PASTA domain-containing protein n=1 Tax=Micromonospora sp. ALFpr18c TaxID=1458665 RepID=UPI001788B6EB|nr:PASTA domain-containing protein [Micromonospora sp. ALFpr18c]